MINKKFKLFQCCIAVKGIKSGVIIDFQRKKFYKVPNQILELIEEYENKGIYELFKDFKESKNTLKKYIYFFLENELIIISDNLHSFPKINNKFNKPFSLDTITIEIENLEDYHKEFFKTKIDLLGISCLKIILHKEVTEHLNMIFEYLQKTKIQDIALFVEYKKGIERKIIKNNPRLGKVIFYNSRINKINKNYHYDTLDLKNVLHKKISGINDFILDLNFYIESISFNSNFNRSLYIDKFGNIQKHILDDLKYGKIYDKSIESVLEEVTIVDFWNITKDKIKVCKDCEFRFICPDGRLPEINNTNEKNFKLESFCKYNPYENKWSV